MSVEDDWKSKSLCPYTARREPHEQHRLENDRGDGFTCPGWSAERQTITTRLDAGEGEKFAPDAFGHLTDMDLGFGVLRRAEVSEDRRTAELVIQVTSPTLMAKIQDGYGVYVQLKDGSIYAGITQEQLLRHREGDQPLPVPNEHPTTYDLVVDDLLARKALGIKRYGVALQPGNGRDNMRDFYEELLDATVYFRTEMEERKLRAQRESYPYPSGDSIVLGPEIFTDPDGKVISWKGVNYVPQDPGDIS
jgi:hypothetical protein